METLKIRYLSDKIEKLRFIDGKSDWIDLRSAEEVNMKAGEARLISLGIAVQLPKGYEAHVVPRSSTFKNFGLIQTNHMGVIDESYCGDHDEWKVPVMAVRDTCIHVNDRICQFRIMAHQPALQFEEVDKYKDIFILKNHDYKKDVYASVNKIGLYPNNTPFESEEWYLIGFIKEDYLFKYYNSIQGIIIFSFVSSLIVLKIPGM